MEKLTLIAGVAGSGKTIIARALSSELGAPLVNIDPFKRSVVDPTALSEGIDPPELRWKYYVLALAHVFSMFEKGIECVILEEMFHVGALRNQIEEICIARGISVHWIEVCSSDEKVRKRIKEQPREDHILNTEQLFRIRAEVARLFDPFNQPNHYRVQNDGSVHCAVQGVLEWMRAR